MLSAAGDGNRWFHPAGAKHRSHLWGEGSGRQPSCTVTEGLGRGCQNKVRSATGVHPEQPFAGA